jgi:hypothetical protein
VSILIAAGTGVGRCLGSQPRAKVSMMIMRPPQHGHGRGSTGAPLFIYQRPNEIVVVMESGPEVRHIYLNRRHSLHNRPARPKRGRRHCQNNHGNSQPAKWRRASRLRATSATANTDEGLLADVLRSEDPRRLRFGNEDKARVARDCARQEKKMFDILDPLAAPSAEGGNGAHEIIAEPGLVGAIPRLNAGGPHKIVLPRRPGESRFGPRQYYYPASRTGVVPSWPSQMIPSAGEP